MISEEIKKAIIESAHPENMNHIRLGAMINALLTTEATTSEIFWKSIFEVAEDLKYTNGEMLAAWIGAMIVRENGDGKIDLGEI